MTPRILRLLSLLYRYGLRPLVPGGAGGRRCKYEPSCSHYASEAVLQHGWLKGATLAAWRVMRCNPWSHGGYDPVPRRPDAVARRASDSPADDARAPRAAAPLTRDSR